MAALHRAERAGEGPQALPQGLHEDHAPDRQRYPGERGGETRTSGERRGHLLARPRRGLAQERERNRVQRRPLSSSHGGRVPLDTYPNGLETYPLFLRVRIITIPFSDLRYLLLGTRLPK